MESRALLVQSLDHTGVTLIRSNVFTPEEEGYILQVGDVDPNIGDEIVHIFSKEETAWLDALLTLMPNRNYAPPLMVAQIINSIWTAAVLNTTSASK